MKTSNNLKDVNAIKRSHRIVFMLYFILVYGRGNNVQFSSYRNKSIPLGGHHIISIPSRLTFSLYVDVQTLIDDQKKMPTLLT